MDLHYILSSSHRQSYPQYYECRSSYRTWLIFILVSSSCNPCSKYFTFFADLSAISCHSFLASISWLCCSLDLCFCILVYNSAFQLDNQFDNLCYVIFKPWRIVSIRFYSLFIHNGFLIPDVQNFILKWHIVPFKIWFVAFHVYHLWYHLFPSILPHNPQWGIWIGSM